MGSKQLLPFERNRYYVGKMLTAADFQAEQTYFSNKDRFMNGIFYGEGIACGCGVYSMDDQSVLVESGVAIDSLGHEIVIENSVVKKLSAIEGFDKLKSGEATLAVKYAEEDVHPVYAIGRSDREEQEFNHVSETYELLLLDRKNAKMAPFDNTEFLAKSTLFTNDDFMITLEIPSMVCKGRMVKMIVRVKKTSPAKAALTYSAIMQIPAFLSAEKTHDLAIDINELRLDEGQSFEREYYLMTQNVEVDESNIVLKTGTATATVNGSFAKAVDNVSMKIELSRREPKLIIDRAIGRQSLETRNGVRRSPYVFLADIDFTQSETNYIIDNISEERVKNYIEAPADELLRSAFLEYFSEPRRQNEENKGKNEQVPKNDIAAKTSPSGMEIATGTLEIPVGDHVKRGDIRFSGEIMHGLGKGNVYVEVGYENIEENKALGANSKYTIYGDPSLFASENAGLSEVETSVKVLNDKGSFVVAAKFTKDVDFLIISYNWVAIKFPTGDKDIAGMKKTDNMSIQAETPTVVLGAKESYYFGVRFNNMPNCSVTYDLTENGSGEITSDGVYTAPGKDGVYEIKISCTDNPLICTYAYAIVKKNEEENKDDIPVT